MKVSGAAEQIVQTYVHTYVCYEYGGEKFLNNQKFKKQIFIRFVWVSFDKTTEKEEKRAVQLGDFHENDKRRCLGH